MTICDRCDQYCKRRYTCPRCKYRTCTKCTETHQVICKLSLRERLKKNVKR